MVSGKDTSSGDNKFYRPAFIYRKESDDPAVPRRQ